MELNIQWVIMIVVACDVLTCRAVVAIADVRVHFVERHIFGLWEGSIGSIFI